MESQKINQIEQKQQSCVGLALQNDTSGQKALAVELYDRFHAMKTWGKEPESLESIIRIFKKDIQNFTSEQVLKAISLHSQRSQEFPTVTDIIGIIQRNGKPPLKESDIIAIRKKEIKTKSDWQMLAEWDAQQRNGWDDSSDNLAAVAENEKLRAELKAAKSEISRLNEIMRLDDLRKAYTPPQPKVDKVQNTIDAMKAEGYPESDIQEFLASLTAMPQVMPNFQRVLES